MHITELTPNNIKLLKQMQEKKVITSRSQTVYGGLGFYGASKFLIKHGIMEHIGTNDNRQKIYSLTEKGNKLITMLIKVSELIYEDGYDGKQ